MTEIEKMFENAGIKPLCQISDGYCGIKNVYEDFTAEEQIKILIALANYNLYEEDKRLMIDSFNGEIYIGFYQDTTLVANATDKEFSKCVAKIINNLWQDLTDQEKEEIRNILNA